MSMIPFIFWGAVICIAVISYVGTAIVIEKSGKRHLGACGHLFGTGEASEDVLKEQN